MAGDNGWTRDHGDIVAHSLQEGIPWPEALLSSDYRAYSPHLEGFWEIMRSADNAAAPRHARYLMVNPIDALSYARLAPYHGDRDYMPLPAPWNTYEFNNPRVKTAMVNYLIAAIEFYQPEYVATSIEANILLANAPQKWNAFKELNAYLYTTIKQLYPNIKVFTTLHYEHMLGLAEESRTLALAVRNTYPNVLEAEVKDLMRYSDYVGQRFLLSGFKGRMPAPADLADRTGGRSGGVSQGPVGEAATATGSLKRKKPGTVRHRAYPDP